MRKQPDVAQKTTLLGDMEFANEKYAVEYIDLDIMAKFISTKDLSALVRSYNVKQLNTVISCIPWQVLYIFVILL